MHYKREKKLQWTYYKYNSELYFSGSNNRKMGEEEMLAFSLRVVFEYRNFVKLFIKAFKIFSCVLRP